MVQNYLIWRDAFEAARDAQKAASNYQEAATIALRLQSVSPASAEISRNAAVAVYKTGRWAQALPPAQQWRALTLENLLPADQFIAELHLRLEDYDAVLRDLQPYVEQAKIKPKDFTSINIFRAQALLMHGDDVAAADLLSPLLATEPQMRAVWRDLSQFLPNPLAEKWLTRLADATPADQLNEHIDLAIAWHGLFAGRDRFAGSNDPKHKQAAAAILDRLATTSPDHPFVIQARAILAHGEGRTGAAEQGYRRALEIKPDLPISLNNLAMLVCDRGDHKEALSLAQRAVAASPGDAGIRDTLAYVQLKLKDYPKAQESFKAATKIDPKNIKWRIKLAQAYDEAGQLQELATTLDEIEKMINDAKVTEDQRDTIRQLRTKVPKTASR
jgi:Flp pilus assembly protein TadD